ncbi:hypothetical protein GMA11_01135 [Granulicatella sp. zg-ZJ]|uniref:cyclic-di-AMP receptor n=1 Tax=unclassified Granulicatella TaxID=2630493 RepID=UPI0013C0C524|nr:MULTISPECIES: cyclic-di-AMP receptor [unclassified Granulicatella]MBS4749740.1 cyclic-di-AMP receptor [Carnobacteriaceae bacterium zg-ZUI78]NEW61988.1 hypothetical protein [Granulicatella sp. zg-ZJ]NEW65619.1 hypothetical protein [Granulicatella sp. zg-84]QMI85740.1 cyclic-di-AMP receptor [Carnobacteriaceae bacterium zg-84]
MKLVVAIVQDKDSLVLSQSLIEANLRSTRLASTGGLLRNGSTTFLIGVEDERLQEALDVIKENCSKREEIVMQQSMLGAGLESLLTYPLEVAVGGATVFVLPIEQFNQF